MSNEIIRLICFGLFVPITDLSLKWIWKAVYRSSHKRESDVERYQQENLRMHRRHSRINAWLIDTSPNPHKTQLIIWGYYILLSPSLAGMALSNFGLFTNAFDSTLNVLKIIVPVIFITSFIIGLIYKKTAKELDFSEIQNAEITTLESQQLADYADNWETGEFKNKTRYRPSNLPKYIFLIIWFAALISMLVFAFTHNLKNKDIPEQTTESVSEALEKAEIKELPISEIDEIFAEHNLTISDEPSYLDGVSDGFVDSVIYKGDSVSFIIHLFSSKENATDACLERIDFNGISGYEYSETPNGIVYEQQDRTVYYKTLSIDNVLIEIWNTGAADTEKMLEAVKNVLQNS